MERSTASRYRSGAICCVCPQKMSTNYTLRTPRRAPPIEVYNEPMAGEVLLNSPTLRLPVSTSDYPQSFEDVQAAALVIHNGISLAAIDPRTPRHIPLELVEMILEHASYRSLMRSSYISRSFSPRQETSSTSFSSPIIQGINPDTSITGIKLEIWVSNIYSPHWDLSKMEHKNWASYIIERVPHDEHEFDQSKDKLRWCTCKCAEYDHHEVCSPKPAQS